MTRECVSQAKRCEQMLRETAVTQWSGRGGEGDDVVATLARRYAHMGFDVLVWSTDGDLRQLVTDRLRLLAPNAIKEDGGMRRDRLYDIDGVIERVGVPPELVPAQKALMGDSGDNVRGVPGVGEKTAADLVLRYSDETKDSKKALDNIIDAAFDVSEKYEDAKKSTHRSISAETGMTQRIAGNIVEHVDVARLALQLVTLRDIDISSSVGRNDIDEFRAQARRNAAWDLLSDRVLTTLFEEP